MGADLRGAAVATGQHKAGSEGAGGLAGRGKLASVVVVDIGEMEVLGPGSLQRRDALAAAAHRLCSRGRCVRRGAVWHVSVCDVGAARGWRLLVQLFLEAERRGAADGARRADALTIGIAAHFVGGFGVKRAMAQERGRALVALLLEPLRAHGAEEAVGGQGDMRPARGCRRATLWAHTARHADAALRGAGPSRRSGLRPPVLAARGGSRDGRGPRGRQAGLSCRARHAQDAAAGRAALEVGRRHCRRVGVGANTRVTNCMTSTEEARCGGGSGDAAARKRRARREQGDEGGRSDWMRRSVDDGGAGCDDISKGARVDAVVDARSAPVCLGLDPR